MRDSDHDPREGEGQRPLLELRPHRGIHSYQCQLPDMSEPRVKTTALRMRRSVTFFTFPMNVTCLPRLRLERFRGSLAAPPERNNRWVVKQSMSFLHFFYKSAINSNGVNLSIALEDREGELHGFLPRRTS